MSGALQAELERASRGLLYLSEGEAPFEYVALPGAGAADLAPERFGAAVGAPPGTRVTEESLARFFRAQLGGVDPADPVALGEQGAFGALVALLQARLAGVRVLRVGEVQIRCYVVGVAADGAVAGLATTAVET
jgi:hypothetical protein